MLQAPRKQTDWTYQGLEQLLPFRRVNSRQSLLVYCTASYMLQTSIADLSPKTGIEMAIDILCYAGQFTNQPLLRELLKSITWRLMSIVDRFPDQPYDRYFLLKDVLDDIENLIVGVAQGTKEYHEAQPHAGSLG